MASTFVQSPCHNEMVFVASKGKVRTDFKYTSCGVVMERISAEVKASLSPRAAL